MPARWLYDRPLRMTSAASRGSRLGCGGDRRSSACRGLERCDARPTRAAQRFDQVRRAHLGLAVRRGGERRHHAGDAERAGARVALPPAFGDDVDDGARRGTSPSRRRCSARAVGAGRAARARSRRRASPACQQAHRRAELAAERLAQQPAVGDRQRKRRGRTIDLRVASTARPNSRSRLPQSSRGSAQPAFQPNAGAAACIAHGRPQSDEALSTQNMRSRKRAESERISCAAQAVARGHRRRLHRRALGGEPARADLGIGQEGRGHDRLDRRCRHRVVEHRRIQQRVGTVADRVRQALVASRRRGPGRRIPGACTATARRRAPRCGRSRRR